MELLKKNFEFGGITYLVCSNGDIFGPTGKQLKARENGDGYAVVMFFASPFWTKLQNIFGHCCMSILDKVAKCWPVLNRPAE